MVSTPQTINVPWVPEFQTFPDTLRFGDFLDTLRMSWDLGMMIPNVDFRSFSMWLKHGDHI